MRSVISKVPSVVKSKWEDITSLGVAHLFHCVSLFFSIIPEHSYAIGPSLKIMLTLEIGHCRVKVGWVTLVQPTDLELSLLVFRNPFFQFVRTRPSCAGPTGAIMDIPRFFEFCTFFGHIWTRNYVITTFIIGWWISIGSCFTYKRRIAWRTSSRAKVSRAVVMHISYSSEWHLIDKLLRHLLHVNPATSATSCRQIKMFDQQKFHARDEPNQLNVPRTCSWWQLGFRASPGAGTLHCLRLQAVLVRRM